jgi:hypothetical protein
MTQPTSRQSRFGGSPPHFEHGLMDASHAMLCVFRCADQYTKTQDPAWHQKAVVITRAIKQDLEWRFGTVDLGEIDRYVAEIATWNLS